MRVEGGEIPGCKISGSCAESAVWVTKGGLPLGKFGLLQFAEAISLVASGEEEEVVGGGSGFALRTSPRIQSEAAGRYVPL